MSQIQTQVVLIIEVVNILITETLVANIKHIFTIC